MATGISQIEIGNRIMALRKAKGLSQEELAKNIGISRTSLLQVEQGKRHLDVIEFQKLSFFLQFSVNDFLSQDFLIDSQKEIKKEKIKKVKSEERIAVPEMSISKFKNILLYILEKCAGKPNVGETVLYKLLYFSDFNYYEIYEEHLSGARYRKLAFGPVPRRFDSIINAMIEKEEIQKIKTQYFNKTQTRYIPLTKADLTKLKASEKEVIDKVIEQMSDWSAATISNYSHGDKPWKATANNEEINYELAFYRRPPYSVRVYEEDEYDTI